MEQHVSAVVRSSFFHIRSLSKVHPYITYKAASSIAVCLILSKLDYCNSLLSGLPQKHIKRLQAVQNAAARTHEMQKNPDHITPILRQLHWLPIQKRIRHKIISATYRSVHNNTPLYLSDLLQKHNPSRLLRSASRSLLDVPGPRDSKKAVQPASLQICRSLPLECPPREHQGEGLHSVFQTFAENPFLYPGMMIVNATVYVRRRWCVC